MRDRVVQANKDLAPTIAQLKKAVSILEYCCNKQTIGDVVLNVRAAQTELLYAESNLDFLAKAIELETKS